MSAVVPSRVVAVVMAVGVTACAVRPPGSTEQGAVGATAPEIHESASEGRVAPTTTDASPPMDLPDVWVDEPPLGPLPAGEPPRAETSKDAVAGYLVAAHTVAAEDARHRHRRHHPWMHPAAPGRTGGHWTPDPPDAGVTRRVEILQLDLIASAEQGAAWEATYRLWDGSALHAERTRHVATRQVDDGRWLVMTETVDLQPVAH